MVDGVLIKNCYVYNTGLVSSNRTNAAGITRNGSNNVTFEFNTFENSGHGGIAITNYGYEPGVAPQNYIFRNNKFLDIGTFSLNGYFDYNYFYGTGAVYDNIFVDTGIQMGAKYGSSFQ